MHRFKSLIIFGIAEAPPLKLCANFQDKLDDSAHKILSDYQTATVTLLSLISAAVGDVCDSSPYQIIDLAF